MNFCSFFTSLVAYVPSNFQNGFTGQHRQRLLAQIFGVMPLMISRSSSSRERTAGIMAM